LHLTAGSWQCPDATYRRVSKNAVSVWRGDYQANQTVSLSETERNLPLDLADFR
jgi:hypothetical protein